MYFGSTIEKTLTNRLSKHRQDYKKWLIGKQHYISSYEILKFDDAKIILMENFPCKTKYELLAREQHYIDNNDCVNKLLAFIVNKPESRRNYRELHKREITEYKKQYHIDHKEQIKQYTDSRKSEKCEYDKQYREKNKEKSHTKFECPCGGKYLQMHKATHEKTKRHMHKRHKQTTYANNAVLLIKKLFKDAPF